MGGSEQPQDDAVGIVLDILKSGDQQMQTAAIAMVRDLKGPEVTKALANELPNLSEVSQVQLLSALADRGDPLALPAVKNCLKSPNLSIRIAAIRATGALGDASCVDLLAQRAADTRGEEQKAARDSLYRLSGPGIDGAILVGISKADSNKKVELITSISERNIDKGVDVLLKTAEDPDKKVRIESFRSLRQIANPDRLPDIIKLLLQVKDSSGRIEAEKTVASVAGKIEQENHRAERVLAVLPTARNTQNRCSLLSVLGQIGDNSSLPVLVNTLQDKNVDIQTAAVRALADWPTPEPLNDLLDIAENSDNQIHKILALRGFIRLLGLDDEHSDKEKLVLYKKAMNLAANAVEKKKILSGISDIQSPDALEMAVGYSEDETLNRETGMAVMKIAESIYSEYPEQTRDVLDKFILRTKNETLRKQALELIEKIKQL